MAAFYHCPHCAELVDTDPDPGAGLNQEYLEDCPVCCRPNRIYARFSQRENDYVVQAMSEG